MKKILIYVLITCFATSAFAQKKSKEKVNPQNARRIEVQIKGLSDTTLLLGYHYGSKKLVLDTIRLDAQGRGAFVGDTLLDGGLYLVITPNFRYFEMILDENQRFSVITDTTDLFGKLQFIGSEANEVFLRYQRKSSEIYVTRQPYFEKLKLYYDADTTKMSKKQLETRRDSIAILQAHIKQLREEMISYENQIIANHPTSLLASILNTTKELEIPDYPRNEQGEITDSLFKYTYMKRHYFSRVNLGDDRLLRTPVYEGKLEQYFDRELIQVPDSIITAVDALLADILAQEGKGYEGRMYYYTLNHLFMKYQNPKYMGLDNVFVHLMKDYYLPHKLPARVIADTAYMAKVKDRYDKTVFNQIGATAPDLLLYNNKNFWQRLHSIDADFTVVYFYDTDCGHCKKIIPEWHDLFVANKFRERGVACVLIYTQTDTTHWQKFIAEKSLQDCYNVFDPYQNTNFRTLYDIYSTPVSYVFDRNKKIIAKRLPPETIVELLNHELDKKKKQGSAQPAKQKTLPPAKTKK
ncbi:MAG: redoxin domain-containing protein [Bacteroidales bacterium]|jgi:peroxiredoxin|nr:redoxin domain-containing protein [Bacteroidales bacterium]